MHSTTFPKDAGFIAGEVQMPTEREAGDGVRRWITVQLYMDFTEVKGPGIRLGYCCILSLKGI